jgi:hypothetical protein
LYSRRNLSSEEATLPLTPVSNPLATAACFKSIKAADITVGRAKSLDSRTIFHSLTNDFNYGEEISSRARPAPDAAGGGGGFCSFAEKNLSRGLFSAVLPWQSAHTKPDIATSRLVQPCNLKHPVDVPAFAAYGSGNFCCSHPVLA